MKDQMQILRDITTNCVNIFESIRKSELTTDQKISLINKLSNFIDLKSEIQEKISGKKDNTKQETNKFENIIIGQEAICPDGLGKITIFNKKENWVQVETYYHNKSSKWSPDNIELIDPRK